MSVWKFAGNFFVPHISTDILEQEDTDLLPVPAIEMLETRSGLSNDEELNMASDLLEDTQLEDPLTTEEDGDGSDLESEQGELEGDAQADILDKRSPPPTVAAAQEAYKKLKNIIRPLRNTGNGYKNPNLDLLTRGRLEGMKNGWPHHWIQLALQRRVHGLLGDFENGQLHSSPMQMTFPSTYMEPGTNRR
jgi:hypothetical protein